MATGFSKSIVTGSEEDFDIYCFSCLEDGTSKKAEKYCENCEMFYCEQCLRSYGQFPANKDHQIVEKSVHVARITSLCSTHHGKPIEMFCGDHDVVCCAVCIAVDHRTCGKVDYISDIAKGIKDSAELRETKRDIGLVLNQLKHEKARRQWTLLKTATDNKRIIRKIDLLEEEIIFKVRHLADNTRLTIISANTEIRKTLEVDITTLNETITITKEKMENINVGNDTQVFASVKDGKKAVDMIKTIMRDISQPDRSKSLKFLPYKDKLMLNGSIDSLGIVTVDLIPELRKYSATFSDKFEVDHEFCWVTALCIFDDDTLLVLLEINSLCVAKTVNMREFRLINQLDLPEKSYSLCKVRPAEVAVALAYCRRYSLYQWQTA